MKNVHGIYHNRHFTLRQLSKAFHAKRDQINAMREKKDLTYPSGRNLLKLSALFELPSMNSDTFAFAALTFCAFVSESFKYSKNQNSLSFLVFFFSGGDKWHRPLWENFDLITH